MCDVCRHLPPTQDATHGNAILHAHRFEPCNAPHHIVQVLSITNPSLPHHELPHSVCGTAPKQGAVGRLLRTQKRTSPLLDFHLCGTNLR